MPYVSYVFTLQVGKKNSYNAGSNGFEVKSVIADGLQVWVTDRSTTPPTAVKVFENKIELATSIIVGRNHYLEFVNSSNGPKEGYFGAST
jgi:hypothetical protein